MEIISREEAKTLGLSSFFTGAACKHGHVGLRRTINSACRQCDKVVSQKLHRRKADDPEYRQITRIKAKAWAQKNPGKYRENQKRYREANKEKAAQYFATWIAANKERYQEGMRAGDIRRQTRKKQNGGKCTVADIRKLFALHAGKCGNCKKRSDKLEIDHIQPISKGGSCDPANLQLLCKSCNRKKHAKDPILWAQENGRLL